MAEVVGGKPASKSDNMAVVDLLGAPLLVVLALVLVVGGFSKYSIKSQSVQVIFFGSNNIWSVSFTFITLGTHIHCVW